jgi:hypothetical protein
MSLVCRDKDRLWRPPGAGSVATAKVEGCPVADRGALKGEPRSTGVGSAVRGRVFAARPARALRNIFSAHMVPTLALGDGV